MNAITCSATLFLRRGNQLAEVTPRQASVAMGAIRERAMMNGQGSRDTRNLSLYDIDGRKIGYVSWNGRVWSNDGSEICVS